MEADRKTVKLERFHGHLFFFFFFSEILYLHKIGESTNTLLRRQNHYSTFNLNTGRTIDAKHGGLRYLHGEKKASERPQRLKAGDRRTLYSLCSITFP